MDIAWLPQKKDQSNIHIPVFDALRGIAAFLVVMFHFWTFFPWGSSDVPYVLALPFAGGHLGVDMFFVISGCLVSLSLFRNTDVFMFFWKRCIRIIPLAVLFVVTIFVYKAGIEVYSMGSVSFDLVWNLLAHLFFIQAFFESTYHGLHPVMWTLTVEVLFYCVLPILLFWGRKKLTHFIGIIVVLILVSWMFRFWVFQFFQDWTVSERIFYTEQLWGRFDQFALGIFISLLWVFQKKWVKYCSSKLFLWLRIIGIFGFVCLYFYFSHIGSSFRDILFLQVFLHFIVTFFLCLAIIGIVFDASLRMRSISFLTFLGTISYSVYLWHFPIQSFWSTAVQSLHFGVPIIISFFCTTVLTVIISYFSWRYFEKSISKIIKEKYFV